MQDPPTAVMVALERTFATEATWWTRLLLDRVANLRACSTRFAAKVDFAKDPLVRLVPLVIEVDRELALVTSLQDEIGISALFAGGGRCVLVKAHSGGAEVAAWAGDHDAARNLCRRVLRVLPRTRAEESTDVPISFWHHAERSIVDIRDVACPTGEEVAANYAPRVASQLAQLAALERPDDTGKMILWYGPPGTGKTHAVRALARSWATRLGASVEVVVDPEVLFASSAYLHSLFLSDHAPRGAAHAARRRLAARKACSSQDEAADDDDDEVAGEDPLRLVVLEDAAELFASGCRDTQGFARLLNLTDGVLGQGRRLVFLLTTNQEIGRIDPALVRPGRCIQALEFEAFEPPQAKEWLLGRARPDLASALDGPRTLAELYGMTAPRLTPSLSCADGRLGFACP